MKVVLSFDDSLLDFYQNAFPLLKKYNVKASLNVISGFCDKSVKTNYVSCTYDQIKEMAEYGIEIANHTNSHKNPTTVEDINLCQKKLYANLSPLHVNGLVLPENQRITNKIIVWCKKNGIKYIRTKLFIKNSIFAFIVRFLHKIKIISDNKKTIMLVSHIYSSKGIKIIPSLEIKKNNLSYVTTLLKATRQHDCVITLMFHSILEDYSDGCPYPEGSWTSKELETLILFCLDRDILFLTQSQSVN